MIDSAIKAAPPPRPSMRHILRAALGGTIALGLAAILKDISHVPLVLGSFGATCVLAFGFPQSPFSQPRNIVAGHFISSLVGLTVRQCLGPSWFALALAAGLAIAAMLWLRVVHPPAGSNPVIVFLGTMHWNFLLVPTLVGALIITLVAIFFNRYVQREQYPLYW
jgi:CBS-domain-containing membrane protein